MKFSINGGLAALALLGVSLSGGEMREIGFQLVGNMLTESNLPKMEKVIAAAASSGYNTVYLGDAKFFRFDTYGPRYAANVKRIADFCREKKLRVIAQVAAICDGSPYLAADLNRAEGAPTVGAAYVVRGGKLVPATANYLKNGDFKAGLEHWMTPDAEVSAVDGVLTLRKTDGRSNARRVWQKVRLAPFGQYRLTAKIKTVKMKSAGQRAAGINLTPIAFEGKDDDGQYLNFRALNAWQPIADNQDFTQYTVVFNTFGNGNVLIYVGALSLAGGEIHITDVKLTDGQFVNVLRRADTPVEVCSVNGRKTYVEGRDYTPVVDPKLGNARWCNTWDFVQSPPEVKIPVGSALKEGDSVKVSYHNAVIGSRGALFCQNDPELFRLIEKGVAAVEKAIRPDGYFLNIDEVRAYGWDPACVKSGKGFAEALGDAVVKCHAIVKKYAPDRPVYVWNDMYDPFHNAKPGEWYYLTRNKGGMYGSWQKLPRDIIIADWTSISPENLKNSLNHFHRLGMKCVIFPGYFTGKLDASAVQRTRTLLQVGRDAPNCVGTCFAQWGNLDNYHNIEPVGKIFEASVR